MKKRILLLFAFVLFASVDAFAQDTKLAYADADSIFRALPETANIQTRLEKYAKQWEDQLKGMEEDLQTKYEDFVKYRDSTDKADIIPKILQDKAQAVQELEQKLQQEQRNAQIDVAKKEQELLAPLREKITKGIDETAKELGYAYVVPKSILLYSDPAHDLTQKVIEKLSKPE